MVALFLAEGFEEIEALTVVDVLRRAKIEIQTVGIGGLHITGAHGIGVIADVEDTQFDSRAVYDALILPGGMPGTRNLEASSTVIDALKRAPDTTLLAAICAAPSILGHLGLLKNVRAVCFPGYEKDLHGAILSQERVCADGRFLTAVGAGAAMEFALRFVEHFQGQDVAKKLADDLIV